MELLDCETFDSTLHSVCQITKIPKESIKSFLKKINLRDYYKKNPNDIDTSEKVLIRLFQQKFSINTNFDGTYYFHATRTYPTNKFKNGILPLGMCIDDILEFLYSLIDIDYPQEEWNEFKSNLKKGINSNHGKLYQSKLNDKYYWGPFGFLIKEIISNPEELRNHDYLKIPEIIEDICYCFKEQSGYDLLKKYKKVTKACIVKFKTTDNNINLLGSALLYLYDKYHNSTISPDCNYSYDGKGKKIPNYDIKNIQFI